MLVAISAGAFLKEDPHEMRYHSAIDLQAVHDLSKKHAVLEERMNTKQAEYKTDIGKLAGQFETLRTDMAKRETRFLLAVFGMVALATTILGFLIRMPAVS